MNTEKKIVSVPALKRKLSVLRKEGRQIAFTNGCFDILHFGHVTYLEQAAHAKRVLVIGLNSDASIRRIKGAQRPIVPEQGRARLLAGLACVDFVVLFNEDTPYELIKALRPDILIKGADWKGKTVVGQDLVEAGGGHVELVPYVDNFSTTNIIQTILKKCQ